MNQTYARSAQHDYRHGVLGQVLLVRQIAVASDKNFKLSLCQREKASVLDAIPAHVLNGFDIVAGQVARQPPI
jgi:hypothetical protein